MIVTNCQRLATLVRQETQDIDKAAWSDDEIMEAIDVSSSELVMDMIAAGKDWHLEELEILSSDAGWNERDRNFWEITLPRRDIQQIRLIEGVLSGRPGSVQVDRVELHLRRETTLEGGTAVGNQWTYLAGGARGNKIGFIGRLQSLTKLRVWYMRRFPPLHFGTLDGGTANTITFPADPTGGRAVQRDDVYNGMEVEFTNGALIDQVAVISDYVGATRIATLEENPIAVPSATTTYALIPIIPAEQTELVALRCAHHLWRRMGQDFAISFSARSLASLERDFKRWLNQRDQQSPKRVWSNR